jgi:uncharacterized C2H2 Zn-finger protein
MERCPGCGHWFKSRKALFGHGAHCDHFETFSEYEKDRPVGTEKMSWSEFRNWYLIEAGF